MILPEPFTTYKTIRWYGDHDPVSLSEIRQSGCEGIVTALHQIPVGATWSPLDIQLRKAKIEQHNLTWKVVESLPVHEDIKRKSGDYKQYIENYKASMANLAQEGIEVITYNFMPVFDWLRTATNYTLESGVQALSFNKLHYILFDLFILKREGASNDYSEEEIQSAQAEFEMMSEASQQALFKTIMLGLPGSTEQFTIAGITEELDKYQGISASKLRENLAHFLTEVIPVAEKNNIKLAIHPDDPPFPVFGLPRILCNESDAAFILNAVDSAYNGLCFCTGSYGANPANNLERMFERFKSRVHFLHLRNTKATGGGNFHETYHLDGDTNMVRIMQQIVEVMQTEQRRIPMRPDHGFQMLDDLHKESIPGYSMIGRLKGLAELSGLELGIASSMD